MSDTLDPNAPKNTPKPTVDLSNLIEEGDDQAQDHFFDDESLDDAVLMDSEGSTPDTETTKVQDAKTADASVGQTPDAAPPNQTKAEPERSKGADIIEMANRREGLSLVKNPEITSSVREDAAAMRAMAASAPIIVGKDASLVAFDTETHRLIPRDADAASTLKVLGDSADIGVTYPGSKMVTPLRFNADKYGLERHPLKRLKHQPSREDIRNADIRNIAMEDGISEKVRRAGLGTPNETLHNPSNANNPKPSHQEGDDQTPPMTAGAMALYGMGKVLGAGARYTGKGFKVTGQKAWAFSKSVGRPIAGGVSRGLSALWEMMKWLGQKLMAAGQKLADKIKTSMTKTDDHNADPSADQTRKSQGVSKSVLVNASQAGKALLDTIDGRKRNLVSQAKAVTEGYHATVTEQSKRLGEALGVHKAGASIIKSSEDFNAMLNAATPDQKTKIREAQKAIAERSTHLRDQVETVLQHRDMNLVPMEDRADVYKTMQEGLAKPFSLTKMEAAAIQQGQNLYDGNRTSWEAMEEAKTQATRSVQEALANHVQQATILNARRTTVATSEHGIESNQSMKGAG